MFWLIDGISGYFLSDWDVNLHMLVNVNVPEKNDLTLAHDGLEINPVLTGLPILCSSGDDVGTWILNLSQIC